MLNYVPLFAQDWISCNEESSIIVLPSNFAHGDHYMPPLIFFNGFLNIPQTFSVPKQVLH